MRSFPIFLALILCACTASRDEDSGSTQARAARPAAASNAPATAPAASIPVFSSGLPSTGDRGGDGIAELQRLTATKRMIALDRVDEDSASAAEFTPNVASTPSAYAGEYHFGDSEWESSLTLSVEGNTVTGELGYADWENETWVGKRVRFEGGTITGASFTAPGWKGVFVLYNGEPGVIILRAPTDRIGIQYGNKL